MSLATPMSVLIAILFLVPGLLMRTVAQLCTPYATERRDISFVECLMLSCFNYLLCFWVFILLLKYRPSGLSIEDPLTFIDHFWYLFLWLSCVFLLPAILGLIAGRLGNNENVRSFIGRLGLTVLHPAPTAWDYAFARESRYWVRIQLTNGEIVEGLFDSNSLASGKRDTRDIFIELVFELEDQDGEQAYVPLEQNAGLWVNQSEITSIEFFDVDPEDSEWGQEAN